MEAVQQIPDQQRAGGVSDEQHVTWLELFFDLVFVAWISLVNTELLENETPSLLLGFDATLVAFTIWMIVSVVNNRCPSGGFVRTGTMVLIMLLVLVTALTIRPDDGLRNALGALLLGVVYLCCTVLLLDVRRLQPDSRLNAPIALTAAAGVVCIVGAPSVGEDVGGLYSLAEVVVLGTVFAIAALVLLSRERAMPGPIRPGHLDERWGQLVIIVLGEGFLVLAEVLLGRPEIPNPTLFVLIFLCTFAFWRLYFDSAMRVPVRESARVFALLTTCHLFLILGLLTAFDFLAQGVGIELAFRDDYLLGGGSLAIVFTMLAAIGYVRRGRMEKVITVNLLLALAFVVLAVIADGDSLQMTHFIAISMVMILAYALVVRFVDPRARPLRGDTALAASDSDSPTASPAPGG